MKVTARRIAEPRHREDKKCGDEAKPEKNILRFGFGSSFKSLKVRELQESRPTFCLAV